MIERRRFLLLLSILCSILIVTSCKKIEEDNSSGHYLPKNSNNSFGETMVIGEKLNNPYSISIMRAAFDSLTNTASDRHIDAEQLQPNCLYVRFLPRDSAEVALLQNLGLELFEYPLDYDIEVEGDSYHDPTIPEDQITWQYTTVSPDFVFPTMRHQILEECYIPSLSEDDTLSLVVDPIKLEMLAIKIADLPEKYQPIGESKALGFGKRPEGTVRMMNDHTGTAEGIRGVKVRCHYFANISSSYTNENGNYKIGKRYICNPHYAIVFANVKGFVIWGNFAFIAAANHNLGYQSNSGYSTTVQLASSGWKWAVINNAAYDYYKQCTIEGIQTPHPDLRIWCWPNATSSSAPMLHHLFGVNCIGVASPLVSILLTGAIAPAAAVISAAALVIDMGLPDITIGMSSSTVDKSPNHGYFEHYHVVWHELTHASHFRQTGELVWGPYINYIVTHNGYGNGSATSVGRNVCELGESWAFANEHLISNYAPSSSNSNEWFIDAICSIYHILDDNILTRKQMYDCLTSDVKSINDFKTKLIERYPNKSSEINAQF